MKVKKIKKERKKDIQGSKKLKERRSNEHCHSYQGRNMKGP